MSESPPQDQPVGEQFIVSGSADVLNMLVPTFEGDPEIELVFVSGPAGKPRRLVARMQDSRAAALQQALGSRVTVVPDDEIFPVTGPTATEGKPRS